ncbi:MAG TPA: XrtA-associated ATPase, partial [Burkholderiaceae bacterium]|nr:XrtA-associated ATPase [Burkholderiaceae bacterium]
MYESHFGFSGSPFQLNPDPAFYFNSKGHSRAMGYLQYGVMQGEGFIVITGEIGAGKTTLLRTLLEGLDRQKVLAAQIVSTQLESGELLQAIITAFGIPAQGTSKAHLIATLEAFLTALAAQGRHALLIVDEAQNLNEKAVEELRMLSNFQLGNHALLQSFLVGQPELRRLLESPQLEQLRQRVIASQHLGPLGPDETQAYVEHRLRHVGWADRPVFAPGAFDHVYAWSGGVPRRINRLANRLLLAAYLENTDRITPALVEQTALELRTEIGESSYQPLPLPVRSPAATAVTAPVAAEPAAAAPEVTEVTEAAEPAKPPAVEAPSAPAEPEAVPLAPSAAQPEPADAVPAQSADEPVTDTPAVPAALPSSAEAETDEAAEPARLTLPAEAVSDAFVETGAAVRDVAARVATAAENFALPPLPVTRRQGPPRSLARDVVLCLADSETSALAFAAVSKHLPAGAEGLRLVLVNPGEAARVWPWEPMERLLPTLEVGLHLGNALLAAGRRDE